MAAARKSSPSEETTRIRRRPPAKTPEELEARIISKALRLVEKQIDDETISATVLAQYVKFGSERERLERDRLKLEAELLEKKAEAMESAKRVEELYEGAIAAMRSYGGHDPVDDQLDDDDY